MTQTAHHRASKRGKKKKRKVLLVFIVIFVIVLIVSGSITAFIMYNYSKKSEGSLVAPPPQNVRKYTTFQEQKRANYEQIKLTFTGEDAEVPVITDVFATELFTIWGMQNADDYLGKDFIPPLNEQQFKKMTQDNLFFRLDAIKKMYGENNMPIVVSTEVSDFIDYPPIYYGEETFEGRRVKVTMHYQDGTVEGTQNDDGAAVNSILNQWVIEAEFVWFYHPTEQKWYIGKIDSIKSKEMLPNEEENSTMNEEAVSSEAV